ncbi:MAG: proline dehydrogenase family protein [Gemmatimonadetes bacterium]|nr:proline dehydrogenase family protein [Gemmatimonadota bacterium]
MRQLFLWASRQKWLGEQFRRRRFAQIAVRRFMPGEDVESALRAAQRMHPKGISTVLTQLGENITQLAEAKAVADHYLRVLDLIAQSGLDSQISIKLTQLGLDVSRDETVKLVLALVRRAAELKNFVWIDMEDSSYTDATLDLYRRVRAQHSNVGVCLQAYLRRTAADLDSLIPRSPSIRLVKGAYQEAAAVAFPSRAQVDAEYLALARTLLEKVAGRDGSRVGFGTHDVRLHDEVREVAHAAGVPREAFEIQMLYGIRRTDQERLAAEGYRVRDLISYGSYWFPWYMRRLAERPANVWFVVKSMLAG